MSKSTHLSLDGDVCTTSWMKKRVFLTYAALFEIPTVYEDVENTLTQLSYKLTYYTFVKKKLN